MRSKLFVVVLILLAALQINAQVFKKQLTEVNQLRLENFKLRVQLIQAQLAMEQGRLDKLFSDELGCKAGFNFETGDCKE